MNRKEPQVPHGGDPIPEGLLLTRSDQDWELEDDDIRIAVVREWAAALLKRVQILAEMGCTVDEDDDFSDLVDELYNGVRQRLTRQDLIRSLLLTLGEKSMSEAARVARQAKAQVQLLDHQSIEEFFGS